MSVSIKDQPVNNLYFNNQSTSELYHYAASLMLEYIDVLQSVEKDSNFNDSCRSIMDKLYDLEPIDDGFGAIGHCPKCRNQMINSGSFSRLTFVMAISYLLRGRMITPKKIITPTKEMIVEVLSENIFPSEVRLFCKDCGVEYYNIVTSDENTNDGDTKKAH